VNKIGAAARAQKLWRERKQEMKFTVNQKSVVFLNNLLRNPSALGLHWLGKNHDAHYRTKSNAASRQVMSLQKWVERELDEFKGQKEIPLDWSKELSLKKVYVDQIIDMMDHYKELANVPSTMEFYWQLRDALEGHKFEDKLEDPSEV